MDEALLAMMRSNGRNRAWAESMVNLEARKLIETANREAGFHIRDGLTQLQFVQEIRDVIEEQFSIARRAKSDEECIGLRREPQGRDRKSCRAGANAAQEYCETLRQSGVRPGK